MRRSIVLLIILVVILFFGQKFHLLPKFDTGKKVALPKIAQPGTERKTVVYEDSVITKVVSDSLPSVVTISINSSQNVSNEFNPFNPFSPYSPSQRDKNTDQNIGSGFIISADGLVITNKHVVSDTTAAYKVLTNDNKKYDVDKIYRDPVNDLAILRINAAGLKPLKLGDSLDLRLGQLVIAIGTPLGEFTNTVTSGIISGLGRGITAGSPFEGYVEKLDNVIQTDAAISAGNSGGPLLNSSGEVIGINTAIASEGQNIGFAIPSNVVSDLITNFNKRGGSFERPYIGVRYKMIDEETAVMNDLIMGAYVVEVLSGSPAEKAGIQPRDIITEIEGKRIDGETDQTIAQVISEKQIGEKIELKLWRRGATKTITATLESAEQ